MELSTDNTLLILWHGLMKSAQSITTLVYVKPTNIGMSLHYNSHVDNGYKKSF